MDPLSLIAGGASLLGSIFGSNTSASNNAANIQMQRETNALSIQENQKNRDFQEQMSSTAYQRASKDMESAGLNPAMMFGSGSAASSPSGGVPSLTAPKSDPNSGFAHMGEAIGKAVNSAIAAKTYDKMTQEIANMQTQQALTSAATKTEAERPALVRSQVATEREKPENLRAERFNVETSTAKEANRMPVSRLEGKKAEDILAMPDWLRRSLNIGAEVGTKAGDAVGPLLNSARRARSLFNDRFYY